MANNSYKKEWWKLGEDMVPEDNLLDPVTFDDLILAVHCNCKEVTPDAVMGQMRRIMELRLEDMYFLMTRNMDKMIELALEGRS